MTQQANELQSEDEDNHCKDSAIKVKQEFSLSAEFHYSKTWIIYNLQSLKKK